MMLKGLPNKILVSYFVLMATNASEMIAAYTLVIGGTAPRCKAGPKTASPALTRAQPLINSQIHIEYR